MSERDNLEVEALVTDRYLDSLLAARERRAREAGEETQSVDPAILAASSALETELSRVHPSFRFEERLAADLQVAALRQRRGGRTQRGASIRRLEPRPSAIAGRAAVQARTSPAGRATPSPTRSPAASLPGPAGSAPQVPRQLLIGGALTSAALSIAGAYVAWRRGRPPLDPMVRAVRAAHRTGLAGRIPSRGAALAVRRAARSR